jgi:nucleoid DNA-binding protein
MSETTTSTRINREELARKLVAKNIVPTKIAGMTLIDSFFEVLKEEVLANNSIAIPDFGKLEKYKMQSGVYKIKFTAFDSFKQAANQ